MPGPRLTYVGHSYHARTGSTLFLQDLLATRFDVTTLWDESWRPGGVPLSADAINATRPDYLVLFQQLPSRAQFVRLHCRNVTWVPMHDGIRYGAVWEGWQPSGMKVLCFCAADREYFSSLGYDTLRVQYCPPPLVDGPAPTNTLSVFFWLRRNEIGWPTLKRLLGPARPQRLILRVAPDPGHAPELPSEDERRAYSVEVIDGWLDAERYQQLLRECALFMAPRPREGIGQAVLDARALGLVAIAPNAPTMNEYIRHGDNGYLYDLDAPAAVDFSGLAGVRERSLRDLAVGHRDWLAAAPSVLEFVAREMSRAPLWWRLRYRLSGA
jgi:hypothetical protein